MESGVSLTTVSLILNKGDQRISDKTRRRVLETIDRLGYRPNRLAQGLQNRRSHILAVLVPELQHVFADEYFGEVISGIYERASRLGYKLLLEVATSEFVRKRAYVELFDRCFVDGLLFIGAHRKHTFLHNLANNRDPVLIVNNYLVDEPLDHVVCDYSAGARLAVEHLLGLGHRRIGMIHGAVEVQTANDVRNTFVSVLKEHGIGDGETRLADGLYTEEGGGAAAQAILERDPKVTALLAGNDKMAIGAMHRLRQRGKRVPEDVSVVGFDDSRAAAFTTPPLTTVRTPLYDLGQHCAERMVDLILGKVEQCQEVLPVDLIIRESTAPPGSTN
jgi:DNA-binding LacI/PurR family transcriptional regulator